MYEQEREHIKAIRQQIDAYQCDIPETRTVIDWGPKARGQGKRSGGHTVKGSMSAAPVGKKTYYGVDLKEYWNEETKESLRYMGGNEAARYIKATKFGCTHIEAKIYSLL